MAQFACLEMAILLTYGAADLSTNPPGAFNGHASCPLLPRDTLFSVRIEGAGRCL
ncbi:hypothetical protein [Pseudooceanicola marinus]|uniref:hypothetical protein n=1 Tax=Pseudooceanicola marinus TaxID=396013 RepID=UPI0012FE2FAB|nr:hypothetical protein [Pseudooceanicola marinus]